MPALYLFERRKDVLFMNLLSLLKGKLLVTALASVVLVGGAAAAFAATPAGQNVVQSLTHAHPTGTVTATHDTDHTGQSTGQSNQDHSACPGLSEAQNLATNYHLKTASQGEAVKAICALHQGTFKGVTSGGVTVTASRVYGYGEIDQLLTYAQYLASHDKANAGGALSDTNVSSYLAAALHSCGTSALQTCLKNTLPNYQPGSGNKPTVTPTARKPAVTPTPHKPIATPTPHQ
jgi:hypothetical protein